MRWTNVVVVLALIVGACSAPGPSVSHEQDSTAARPNRSTQAPDAGDADAGSPAARELTLPTRVQNGTGGGSIVGSNNMPTVTGLSPISTAVRPSGGGALPLTVSGAGFDSSSVVVFNGTEVTTAFVSATSVHGNVPGNLLTNPGPVNVVVRSSAGVSTPASFSILESPMGGGTFCGAGGVTCDELLLAPRQCTIDQGNLVQCESDGCVYVGCE